MNFLMTFDSSSQLPALPHVPLHAPSPPPMEAPQSASLQSFSCSPPLKCSKDSALRFIHFIPPSFHSPWGSSSRTTVLTGPYVCVTATSVSAPPSLSCMAGGHFQCLHLDVPPLVQNSQNIITTLLPPSLILGFLYYLTATQNTWLHWIPQ